MSCEFHGELFLTPISEYCFQLSSEEREWIRSRHSFDWVVFYCSSWRESDTYDLARNGDWAVVTAPRNILAHVTRCVNVEVAFEWVHTCSPCMWNARIGKVVPHPSFLNMWWSFCAPHTLLPLLKLYLAKVSPWCGYFVRPHGHRCLRSSIAQRRSAWTCEMERFTWQVGILRWMQMRQLSKRSLKEFCNWAFEIPGRVVALSTAKLVHQIAAFDRPLTHSSQQLKQRGAWSSSTADSAGSCRLDRRGAKELERRKVVVCAMKMASRDHTGRNAVYTKNWPSI